MIEIINPESEQAWLEGRLKDVTSTEASALFSISPYMTPFELYYRKKDSTVVRIEPNERMQIGTDLQDAIAAHIAKKQGWNIRRMTEYMRDTDVRLGASFDFITDDDELLEIKNVDGRIFKEEWTKDADGNITEPNHIACQVQVQLAVSGRKVCWLGACVGGNHIELIKRTRDEAVIQAIKDKVKAFWASIEANTPPPPDYQADAEFIGKLFGYATPGKVLNIADDAEMTKNAVEYKRLGDVEKDAKEKREAIKAWFLTKIEDAEKCLGMGFSIDCGITGPGHRDYDVPAFRRFKISWKKVK